MSQDYLFCGIVNTCQRDPGMPYLAATSDTVIVSLWTRGANEVMVSRASDMLAGLSMSLNHMLSAGERNDIPGDTNPRLCLSCMIYGLMTGELMDGEAILPPLIADLIPQTKEGILNTRL